MVQKVAMHVVRIMTEPGERPSRDGLVTAVPPAFIDVPPGTLFDVPEEHLTFLTEAGAIVDPDDKRAAKFGYGSLIGRRAVQQEEGETFASAAARRREAQREALIEKRESDLVG